MEYRISDEITKLIPSCIFQCKRSSCRQGWNAPHTTTRIAWGHARLSQNNIIQMWCFRLTVYVTIIDPKRSLSGKRNLNALHVENYQYTQIRVVALLKTTTTLSEPLLIRLNSMERLDLWKITTLPLHKSTDRNIDVGFVCVVVQERWWQSSSCRHKRTERILTYLFIIL